MTHGMKTLRTSATDICGTLLIGSTKSLSVNQERRSPEIVYSSHECERDWGGGNRNPVSPCRAIVHASVFIFNNKKKTTADFST